MRLLLATIRQTCVLPRKFFSGATFSHGRVVCVSAVTNITNHSPYRGMSSQQLSQPGHGPGTGGKEKETFLRKLARIRQKIEEEEKTFGKLVYESKIAPILVAFKIFIYGSSVITMVSLFTNGVEQYAELSNVMFTIVMAATMAIIIAIPWSMNMLTSRFVLRLYYRQDKNLYTAIKFNKAIGDRRFQFTPEDITPVHERAKRTLKGKFTSFYFDQEPMYVNKLWFEVPKYFNHLMGYENMLAKPKAEPKFWRKGLIQK
ncbi:PREDICTED: transmembrane protein 70, mitochondrial-like [Branchiostoma belcheri]|uniref:Transmembrane protein 70, mitochondrial-like n=1 Tax=Branchiostoma belcheri TaxID=7741 RepID=A0A6P5A149_BRABE|nr:PREDICTED: transmembrane protein 70, mitochondrial-like [Branchiostoma belcheri]